MSEEINRIIDLAKDNDPATMGDAVKDHLSNKAFNLINNKRTEMSKDYFTAKEEQEDE